jgi:hypothetical protein
MIALLRLLVIGTVVLTVIYISISLYSRARRKDKLEEWWIEEGRPGTLDEYMEAGLKEYEGSLRRKLIWGVYVVPLTVVGLIIYFTNFH